MAGGSYADIYASSAPDGLAVSSKHRNAVTLKWNAVANATGYNVSYGLHPNELPYTVVVTGPEAVIGNLKPGTPYYFAVQSRPAKPGSPGTEPIMGTTPKN
jgi:Fibronectin type III domain